METRKNTVKIAFGREAKAPGYLDVLRFVANDLGLTPAMVHSVYRDENEQCYFVKLMDREAFNAFHEKMEDQYWFCYADGQRTVVNLETASRQMRYIRLHSLPPEAEEKEIEKVLSRFGKVRQHVRERYPASTGFPVFSGVRGVHMEVEKEIPATLYIGHFRARIFYEGLRNKCFFCKEEGHIKANCPKLAGINDDATVDDQGENQRNGDQQQQGNRGSNHGNGQRGGGGGKQLESNGGNRLYSQVTANLLAAGVSGAGAPPINTNMTSLPLTKRSITTVSQQLPKILRELPPKQDTVMDPPFKKPHIIDTIDGEPTGSSEKERSTEEDEPAFVKLINVRVEEQNENIPASIGGDGGAVGGVVNKNTGDEEMVIGDTNTSVPRNEPEADDESDFTIVGKGKGKGTGTKKKETPSQAIRDRSRSLNRTNRKA